LENRALMSATLFSHAVAVDRFQIRLDFLQLKTDLNADAKTLLTDNAALKANHLYQNTTLQPLVAKLHSDVRSFQLTLLGDRLGEASNVIKDEQLIVGELKQMITDKGNATALAADRTKLLADRVQCQTDMVAGLTQRLSDRQAETNALLGDTSAILTALPTSGASAGLSAAVTQWLGDKGASLDRVTADLQKISADRTQLITDLNAEVA
jgi:hypothetical protein